MAGMFTNSGFESPTQQNFFEVPYIVTEGKDLITGNKEREAGCICKQLYLDGLALSNNEFMGSFLFRGCHVLTLSKIADLRPKR